MDFSELFSIEKPETSSVIPSHKRFVVGPPLSPCNSFGNAHTHMLSLSPTAPISASANPLYVHPPAIPAPTDLFRT